MRGTRTIAPVTRQLSRLRGGQLPRGAVETIDEAVALGEARMWIARPAEVIAREMPLGHPARNPTFAAQTREALPRLAVAEFVDGRVLGPHRAVITRTGKLVNELSPYFGTTRPLEHPLFLHPFPQPPRHFEGRVGVLAARGDHSYYHFLLDVIPRLKLALECQGAPVPERWYVPSTLPFQSELIEMLGIDPSLVIDSVQNEHIRADALVVPSLPDVGLRTPPWAVAYVRDCLLPASFQPVAGRRIYITRGTQRNNRTVTNEPQLIATLAARGFTVEDPGTRSVREQIKLFAEAELIVAPHGGALGSLAFASSGATVIELFAPDYLNGCYWKLADCVPGLRYRYVVGVGPAPRDGRMWGVSSDITVDTAALSRMLDELLAIDPVGGGRPTAAA